MLDAAVDTRHASPERAASTAAAVVSAPRETNGPRTASIARSAIVSAADAPADGVAVSGAVGEVAGEPLPPTCDGEVPTAALADAGADDDVALPAREAEEAAADGATVAPAVVVAGAAEALGDVVAARTPGGLLDGDSDGSATLLELGDAVSDEVPLAVGDALADGEPDIVLVTFALPDSEVLRLPLTKAESRGLMDRLTVTPALAAVRALAVADAEVDTVADTAAEALAEDGEPVARLRVADAESVPQTGALADAERGADADLVADCAVVADGDGVADAEGLAARERLTLAVAGGGGDVDALAEADGLFARERLALAVAEGEGGVDALAEAEPLTDATADNVADGDAPATRDDVPVADALPARVRLLVGGVEPEVSAEWLREVVPLAVRVRLAVGTALALAEQLPLPDRDRVLLLLGVALAELLALPVAARVALVLREAVVE